MILAFILALLVLFFCKAIWRTGYWRRMGICGPASWPFAGNLYGMFLRPGSVVLQLAEWTKQYGPMYGVQVGFFNCMVTADPELARQIMVTKYASFQSHLVNPIAGNLLTNPILSVFDAFGRRWKRIRSCVGPLLLPFSFEQWMPELWSVVSTTVDQLREASAGGKPVDMYSYLGEMTACTIGLMLFGPRLGTRVRCAEYGRLSRHAQIRFNRCAFEWVSWMFPWLGANIVRPLYLRTGKLRGEPLLLLWAKLNALTEERKRQRQNCANTCGDSDETNHPTPFIDMMLDYESFDYATMMPDDPKKQELGRKLAPEEIVMALVTLNLAGFGVANSMAITFMLLAQYPEVQRKCREEIDRICGYVKFPACQELDKLEYCHAVQYETLRLYPVASPAIARTCVEDVQIGEGITLQRGTSVWPDIVTLHRDPTIWGPDAQQFRPERWMASEGDRGLATKATAFYGFGEGPRMCFGRKFGAMEEMMVLVMLLREFNIKTCPETEEKAILSGHAVVAAEKVMLCLEARSAAAQNSDILKSEQ